jgi:hypothetical protein
MDRLGKRIESLNRVSVEEGQDQKHNGNGHGHGSTALRDQNSARDDEPPPCPTSAGMTMWVGSGQLGHSNGADSGYH